MCLRSNFNDLPVDAVFASVDEIITSSDENIASKDVANISQYLIITSTDE
jgi:hypothetical protein